MDPVIEALRAKQKAGSVRPKRGNLRLWMRKNLAAIEAMVPREMSWDDFVATLNEQGIRNDRGERVSVRRAQQTLYTVRRDAKRARQAPSEAGTQPDPAKDRPKFQGIERSGNQVAAYVKRPTEAREFREDAGDEFGLSGGPLPPRGKEEE